VSGKSRTLAEPRGRTALTAQQRGGKAFTLLEVLVVLAIIALLLAATIPVVNSLSKSSGRKGAGSLLLGTIEQARTLALKDGRASYVVFPAEYPAGTAATSDKNIVSRYFYHSVAIFEDDAADPTKPKIQVTEWKVFPIGVSLRSEISYQPDPSDPAPDSGWIGDSFTFTPTGSTATLPFLKFNSAGAVESPPRSSGQIKLRFFEGYVTGTYEKPTNPKNFDESITINRLSGRANYTSAYP
jgi:prepilin-type N-terminal cleavage/methylation domain-containing protein